MFSALENPASQEQLIYRISPDRMQFAVLHQIVNVLPVAAPKLTGCGLRFSHAENGTISGQFRYMPGKIILTPSTVAPKLFIRRCWGRLRLMIRVVMRVTPSAAIIAIIR